MTCSKSWKQDTLYIPYYNLNCFFPPPEFCFYVLFIFRAAVLLGLSTALDFIGTARGRKFHSSMQRNIKVSVESSFVLETSGDMVSYILYFFPKNRKKETSCS